MAGNGWQHVKFGKEVETRFFCLEALNAHDGERILQPLRNWSYWELMASPCHANIGKLFMQIVRKRKKRIILQRMCSTCRNLPFGTQAILRLPNIKFPHQIVINLGEDKVVTGFSYCREQKPVRQA